MQFNRRQFIKSFGVFSLSGLAIPNFAKANIKEEVYSATNLLMGTYVTIKAVHHSQDFVQECFQKAFNTMQAAEEVLTRHKNSSALGQLNSNKVLNNAPEDLLIVANNAINIENISGGAFNPTVLSVLNYLETEQNISKAELKELYKFVHKNGIKINSNQISLTNSDLKITLDGIAKGYIVDKAYAVLEQAGLSNFLINAGGDMRARGLKAPSILEPKPWQVAIEDPYKSRNYPATLALQDLALATSGSYEKKFALNYGHLIDPEQNLTFDKNEILSVSVLAPNAMLADSLATAFSCLPIQKTLNLANSMPRVACLIITKNNIIKSNNWA